VVIPLGCGGPRRGVDVSLNSAAVFSGTKGGRRFQTEAVPSHQSVRIRRLGLKRRPTRQSNVGRMNQSDLNAIADDDLRAASTVRARDAETGLVIYDKNIVMLDTSLDICETFLPSGGPLPDQNVDFDANASGCGYPVLPAGRQYACAACERPASGRYDSFSVRRHRNPIAGAGP
jgi:hypothetical protein